MKYFIAILFLIPTMVSGQEFTTNNAGEALEEMSKRMYKHYQVDDTINGYLISKIKNGISIIGPSETKTSSNKFPQRRKAFKQKVVLKNKNKMYWKFSPTHSFIINPSNLNSGVKFQTKNSWFSIKEDSIFAGVSYTW